MRSTVIFLAICGIVAGVAVAFDPHINVPTSTPTEPMLPAATPTGVQQIAAPDPTPAAETTD